MIHEFSSTGHLSVLFSLEAQYPGHEWNGQAVLSGVHLALLYDCAPVPLEPLHQRLARLADVLGVVGASWSTLPASDAVHDVGGGTGEVAFYRNLLPCG